MATEGLALTWQARGRHSMLKKDRSIKLEAQCGCTGHGGCVDCSTCCAAARPPHSPTVRLKVGGISCRIGSTGGSRPCRYSSSAAAQKYSTSAQQLHQVSVALGHGVSPQHPHTYHLPASPIRQCDMPSTSLTGASFTRLIVVTVPTTAPACWPVLNPQP